MIKEFIKNRKSQKMAVIIEKAEPQKGLVFVMHGLGGFKEQPHLLVMAEAFKENGYTVIRFDTTNTYGESEGNYEQATATNYYEDLEDTIDWARSQEWYQEPFVLVGHSFGGLCTALFAENFPKKVKALAPIAATISGTNSIERNECRDPGMTKKWKESGWYEWESKSQPGIMKRLPWSHFEDRLKYDLLPHAGNLIMPILMIVGEEDMPEYQKMLFDDLPGKKEMHIIAGAPHTFLESAHLKELKDIFDKWIKSLK